MIQYSVVVAAGARARFFTLEAVDFPEVQSGPRLVEHTGLVNPERNAPERTLWSANKTGRNRAPGGGPAHGYDDHRSQHEDEFERRFARNIAEHAARMARVNHTHHVVLVAQNRMLGFLRSALDPLIKAGVELHELAKDLSKLSPTELHEHLSRDRLLPPRKSPVIAGS